MACEKIVGYSSVYRIQFTLACFFFSMMVLMFGVKRSKDPRSGIQNGYKRKKERTGISNGVFLDFGFSKF